MASWDIDPPGVRDVVGRSADIARGFDGDFTTLGQTAQDAAAQTDSPLVNQALADYVASQQQDTTELFQRASAALRAAGQATNAYVQGDHEMVLNAQRTAAAAPEVSQMPGGDRR